MRTVVLGAGPTGCAAALLLARRGSDVTLIDRDETPPLAGADAEQIFAGWDRPAIGQFRQPHNFLGLGRKVLRDDLPDVYADLLRHGATEVRQDEFFGDAPRLPDDADLATIACRRPVFDLALREAVAAEPNVRFHAGTAAALTFADETHVAGVQLASGETVAGDVVVDACGRNSGVPRWLDQAGVVPLPEASFDCQLLYYSRHYRFREAPLPYASILGGPRGDLGYLAFAVFIGDNATFCLCVMAPVWEKHWRALREPDAFERVARQLPGMTTWLEAAEPITDVLPMGQLRNTVRHVPDGAAPVITGLIPIGDARCHTNPTFAFGISLGLAHAATLAQLVDEASDERDLALRFEDAVGADARARYDAVSAEDRDRIRVWSGEPVDPTDRTASMPLFLRSVVYRVCTQDPDLLRAVCRRINLLDPVDALASNAPLLDRAEKLFRDLPRAAPPPRESVVAALHGTSHG